MNLLRREARREGGNRERGGACCLWQRTGERKMVFVSANDHQEWSVRPSVVRPRETAGSSSFDLANTAERERKMSCTKMNDVRWNFHEISAFMTFGKFSRGEEGRYGMEIPMTRLMPTAQIQSEIGVNQIPACHSQFRSKAQKHWNIQFPRAVVVSVDRIR